MFGIRRGKFIAVLCGRGDVAPRRAGATASDAGDWVSPHDAVCDVCAPYGTRPERGRLYRGVRTSRSSSAGPKVRMIG